MGDNGDRVASADDVLRRMTLIVPAKNDRKLRQCLDSVDEDVEIVVALNDPSEEVRAIANGHVRAPVVTEIPEANLGAAYEDGVAAAAGRYLFFMDSDCVFGPGTLRAMAARAVRHPLVKGQCRFTSAPRRLSRIIQRAREFQTSDFVNAYSPPLLYDREIISRMGGYHYSPLIHWQEDREFDFRAQLAGLEVEYCADGVIEHAAQDGVSDLRSGFRYGMGEAIGRELGLFVTPRWHWSVRSDLSSVLAALRGKGVAPAIYRTLWLACYRTGTAWHRFRDPYGVRAHYPDGAAPVRTRTGTPVGATQLSEECAAALRTAHRDQGRRITRPAAA
jgi:glycosyltransferase involved in cell wall biosynthesis